VLEGRERFNPPGMPNGSWEVRIRDLDTKSETYGAIIEAVARPSADAEGYEIAYAIFPSNVKNRVPFTSPLAAPISQLNPELKDLSITPELAARHLFGEAVSQNRAWRKFLHNMTTEEVTSSFEAAHKIMSEPSYATFKANLDAYEEFGDYGAKPVHPGTNLIGPNARLAAESIFVRQYRAALVLLGRLVSPDMARGASEPVSLATAETNTRPGVYEKFVGASILNIGIFKLALDKVHSDYGGIPMKLAPGSRLEDGANPLADAWICNDTLGKIAKIWYLAG
jgi:hypothetical protein